MPEWKLLILLDVLSWVIYLSTVPVILLISLEYILLLRKPKETRKEFTIKEYFKELYDELLVKTIPDQGIFRFVGAAVHFWGLLLFFIICLFLITASIDIGCSFFESKYTKYCHATSSTFESLHSLPNEYGLRALYALLF